MDIKHFIKIRLEAIKKAIANEGKVIKVYAGLYFVRKGEEMFQFGYNPETRFWEIEKAYITNGENLIDYNRFEYRLNTLTECKQYVQTY